MSDPTTFTNKVNLEKEEAADKVAFEIYQGPTSNGVPIDLDELFEGLNEEEKEKK